MKFSKSWLQDYSKEPLPETKKLEEVVTLNAFEIEEVTRFGGDDILDIKVLPNRAHDALGHRGIARDITALLGNTFIDPNEYYKGQADANIPAPTIRIADEKACTRFMSVWIDGVKVAESPAWLKERLNAIGQKSINSIVDITNYVQFSINKPMHAYDAALVAGGMLSARFAEKEEKLTTLDDREIALDETTLVIADAEKPLGLAGVKGGKFSGISAATTAVILESANFNPMLIRKTSQKYGIRTDASKRFENELSDSLVEDGLRMTVALIRQLNPEAKIGVIVDSYPRRAETIGIEITISEINTVLGTAYAGEEIRRVFDALDFSYVEAGDVFKITIPDERLDLRIREDIIEEIARIKGLTSIPSVLPNISRKGVPHKRLYYENKVRNILCAKGFSEIMTYSFGDTGEVEIMKGSAVNKEKLRSSLASGVEQAYAMNMLNAPLLNIEAVKLYEFGNVFTALLERRHLVLAIDDGKKKSSFTEEVDMILSEIKRELGVATIECDTKSTKPYVIELDFDTLIDTLSEPTAYEPLAQTQIAVAYQPVSPYPFIVRDIAVWVPPAVTWETLRALALQIDSPLIVRIDCFDTFSKTFDDGTVKTSYAFRFVLQSPERTLTDDEANVIADKMYSLLREKGYEVR